MITSAVRRRGGQAWSSATLRRIILARDGTRARTHDSIRTDGTGRLVAGFAKLVKKLGAKNPDALAWSAIAEMAGALALSRTCPTRRGRRKSAIRVRWFGRATASIDRHHAASDDHTPGYRPLPRDERERSRFSEMWHVAQERFVDSPAMAVGEADQLVTEVMRVRGYPMADFEPRQEAQVRLLGVLVSSFDGEAEQGDLLENDRRERWKQALSAADRLRDKFGESSISLAAGMKGGFRERTHENPVGPPGKGRQQK